MTGSPNLFSRPGFSATPEGKADTNTRAFLSKFSGRRGPAIPNVSLTGNDNRDWTAIAATLNAIIKETAAQGWTKKGADANETALTNAIRAVTMIPAATEWGYSPTEVFHDTETRDFEYATTDNGTSQYDPSLWTLFVSDGRGIDPAFAARASGKNPKTDWQASLDALQETLPNASLVNLFVSWYGTDLRCGSCRLLPGVTRNRFGNLPDDWSAGGYDRYSSAKLLSKVNGNAAFGGTPSDKSVIDAIRDLKARKLQVAFTPFILMDIPAGNGLQDPYTGAANQPVYPWRGRITKAYGTADKTAQVAIEVAAFVVQYRAFVLWYANLCKTAGGVDIFILGTELCGLTWLRNAPGVYPFVTALKALAADVRAILPASKITYAADWSEWFGHQPGDGSGDVTFHLDPLWADPNIDAIAFDNYWPLSDWRDGTAHLDYRPDPDKPPRAITDYDYLQSNIKGGEGYDWYYASDAARASQTRTPISDGLGKPWVYRYKDIWSWWANTHYDRPGGIESATPTAWVPQSKPIWFTELGTPSVDKATNQPNVFYDPKSSESFFPYFSSGKPDYTIQRRGLHAMLRFFDEKDGAFQEANNPQSSLYAGRMLDLSKVMVYTWDARPYPFFPLLDSVWSDGPNWVYGHWLSGKLLSTIPQGALDSMALATTFAPRHPYIVDPATGKLDKQYSDFFQAIEFVQADPIANVPLQPTPAEAASAVNALLGVLRAQKRIG